MWKLQCFYNPFGEVGQQWGEVVITDADGSDVTHSLPSCEDEVPELLGVVKFFQLAKINLNFFFNSIQEMQPS